LQMRKLLITAAVLFLAGMATTPAGSGVTNYPNPFTAGTETTKIRYTLGADTDVKITIYDLTGQVTWIMEIGAGDPGAEAGVNEVTWDGENGNGKTVDYGIYICVIDAGGTRQRRKIGVR